MFGLANRSAVDIVVIILTTMVAVTMLFSLIGVLILKLVHPELDMSKANEVIAHTLTTIVGALVGFVGGRAYGKLEANGR